jgi:hypothetical protein
LPATSVADGVSPNGSEIELAGTLSIALDVGLSV